MPKFNKFTKAERTSLAVFYAVLFAIMLLASAQLAHGARTDEVWHEKVGTYLTTIWSEGRNILINGSNKYLNFGSVSGSSGYGFRDSGGTMQFKDSGGSWAAFGAGSGGGSNWLCALGYCTPSTTIGIRVNASSTIGDGTGAGGLTVLGNSTTTGNAYFAGNVGIGTTNPYNKLHIMESAVSGSDANADDLFVLEKDGDVNANFIGSNTGTVGFLFSDSTRGVGQVKYNLNTNNMFFISSGGGYAFGEDYWSASPGVNNVVIQGNVGIGSTSPSKKLSITGDMALSSGFYDTASSSGSKGNVLMSTGTSTLWVATSTLFSSLGTVTSVDMSVPTGLSISGNPITTSGTLALALTAGYAIPTTTRMNTWDTAYGWGNHALGGYDQVTTAGDGLTRTVNDFDCDTASATVLGCLTSGDWNIFNNKLASTSIDTSAELATILTDETGTAGSVVFSVSPTLTGTTTLAYASTTGVSGTNFNFTNGTSTTSFFSALGTFTNSVVNTLLTTAGLVVTSFFDLVSGSNPTVDAEGEMALNTATMSFSVATSTTALELPLAPPISFAFASSSWTGTTTVVSRPTTASFDELVTTGICYADGSGKIIVGNGTASSTLVNLSAGTTTVAVNMRFNKNGTRMIYAMGTPTASISTVNCSFSRYYLR